MYDGKNITIMFQTMEAKSSFLACNCSPPVTPLSHMNKFHAVLTDFFQICFNIILPSLPKYSKWYILQLSQTNIFVCVCVCVCVCARAYVYVTNATNNVNVEDICIFDIDTIRGINHDVV